jgi:RNA polymerase sigma-70 factor, ECF subfamily
LDESDWLAKRFEAHRGHLQAVAYRMLGSSSEADDAVQEAWLRVSRSDADHIENLAGWLTTIVARVCLNLLEARRSRREEPLDLYVPDPIVSADVDDPEHQALLGDSVGLALLMVLDTLGPPERVAFVLHDVFGVPFEEIAPIVGRTPVAARQLASRARRRVRGADKPELDISRQRIVVDAFLAAARDGDFAGLLAVLDPDVVLRVDAGARAGSRLVRGANAVAEQAMSFGRRYGPLARRVLVNGSCGIIAADGRQAYSVLGLAIRAGRISEIDILADPGRLSQLDLEALDD